MAIFAGSSARAATLTEIEKPSGVKVRAVFNHWEAIYNENMCYPNGWTYLVKDKSASESWESIITQQVKAIGEDNQQIEIKQLKGEADVKKASIELLSSMFGASDGGDLFPKLMRVFQKKEARTVFYGTTSHKFRSEGGSDIEYNGYFAAIVDLQTSELTIIGYGDGTTFEVRDCDG